MHFSWLGKYRDVGIFLLRVGIGAMMVMHGWPKLAEGQHAWEKVGMAMQHLGVYSYPAIWGFLAAMSETVGGALLVVGFLVRPAALSIAFTMAVATVMTYRTSGNFNDWSHPLEIGIVALSLFIIGAGSLSIDRS